MRVLGISGSLRRESHNRHLLEVAAGLPAPTAEPVPYEALKGIPPFDEDDEASPALAVRSWRNAIADADALLFATPEYNASIPGQLKNAIDWASRPLAAPALRGKPAAVIGASTGMFGALWAQAELRKSLAAAGARVIDRQLPIALADEAFDERGLLADHDQMLELGGILAELVSEATQHAHGEQQLPAATRASGGS